MGGSVSVIAKKLDAFDPMLFELCDETVMKGSDLFLANESARQAFIQYFNKGNWKTRLGPQHALLDDTLDSIDDVPMNKYSDFVFSSTPSKMAAQQLLLTSDYGSNYTDDAKHCFILEDIRQGMKCILLAAIFPLFLESSDYSEYLEAEEKKTDLLFILTSKIAIEKQHQKFNGSAQRVDRLIDLFSHRHLRSSDSLMTVVTEASESIDEDEMHFMLQHSYGLANMFAAVENLHYCVSLATARRDRPGFPLVYVNKAFESATGYKREEIIGRNCSFLQSSNTEKDQIQLMVQALATAKPVKVALTNKRKDGTGSTNDRLLLFFFKFSIFLFIIVCVEFLNLLSMKPVFDSNGVYSYVIGVQYVYSPDMTIRSKDIQLIDDLLYSFPNVLK